MPKNSIKSILLTRDEFRGFVREELVPLKEMLGLLKEEFGEFKAKLDRMAGQLDKLVGIMQDYRDEQDINRSRIEELENIHPNGRHLGA